MGYPAKSPVRQVSTVATMKRSTLPYYFGKSIREAAFNASVNTCGIWRAFEQKALRQISDGNFYFDPGDTSNSWHVITKINDKLLYFMFIKVFKYRKPAYHIIYESWHLTE